MGKSISMGINTKVNKYRILLKVKYTFLSHFILPALLLISFCHSFISLIEILAFCVLHKVNLKHSCNKVAVSASYVTEERQNALRVVLYLKRQMCVK